MVILTTYQNPRPCCSDSPRLSSITLQIDNRFNRLISLLSARESNGWSPPTVATRPDHKRLQPFQFPCRDLVIQHQALVIESRLQSNSSTVPGHLLRWSNSQTMKVRLCLVVWARGITGSEALHCIAFSDSNPIGDEVQRIEYLWQKLELDLKFKFYFITSSKEITLEFFSFHSE